MGAALDMKARLQFTIISILVIAITAAISLVVFSFVGEAAAWMAFYAINGGCAIWFVVRWVNGREGQRSAKRPLDAP